MTHTDWIVSRGESQYPVPDVQTLREWASRGNVHSEDRIWNPLKAEWIAARDMPEIADAIVQPSRPAPQEAPAALLVKGDSLLGLRAAGYLIDVLPALLIVPFAAIPIVGQFFAGVLLGSYWLFRDVTRASLGKLALGTEVRDLHGGVPTTAARITRNITLAAGAFVLAIPIIGYVLAGVVAMIMFWTEVIMLLTQGQRLGDKLAGTMVVKKTA
jgi:uncharacterized RDD family membrane protein YckC